jgi:hypothetical protein
MPKMTPQEEQLYNFQFGIAPYDTPERRRNAPIWLQDMAAGNSPDDLDDGPPRFPSSPETRRSILNALARGNEKYRRPFDKGTVAQFSAAGTRSWAEYGQVVLEMAILDTLLSIEALLQGEQK